MAEDSGVTLLKKSGKRSYVICYSTFYSANVSFFLLKMYRMFIPQTFLQRSQGSQFMCTQCR